MDSTDRARAQAARLSEAGLAVLTAASPSSSPSLVRAARRRYRHLMAGPLMQLLKGQSLRQVARRAGMQHQVVSAYLRGKSDITVGRIPALAAALECEPTELLHYLLAVQKNPLPTLR